ncbi:hypothetical protein ACHAW6_000099, partial [Cyclotella cf. meneghiniana]
MKSFYAFSIMLAASTSAEYMTQSEAEIRTFTKVDRSRRLGKSGKGSSKGSKGGSSKSSKGSQDCEPEIIYKYIYVPIPPPPPGYGWGGEWVEVGSDDEATLPAPIWVGSDDDWSGSWSGGKPSPMPTPAPMWGGSDEDWSGGWSGGK